LAEEGQRLAERKPVAVKTIHQIADWLKGLVKVPASEET
jgi:hypothetical protein